MRSSLSLLTISLLFAAPPPKSGIDTTNFDTTCKPCDDFWRFANGGWMDRNPIPATQSGWGTMSVVREGNKERIRVILEAAALAKNAPGSNEQKIGDLYAACMDTARIEKLGAQPIAANLARIGAIDSRAQLKSALVEFLREGRGAAPVGISGSPDMKNSREIIAAVRVSGISLSDRDFYLKDDERSKSIRAEFVRHVDAQLKHAGLGAGGETLLAFETATAAVMPVRAHMRDPYARYNKKDLAGLAALAPEFDWKAAFTALKISHNTPINVAVPKTLEHFNKQLAEAPLETWKLWLQWRVINAAAPNLSAGFADEKFRFFSTVLNGTREPLPRWQRCSDTVDSALGFALGQVFVKKHFPPTAKVRMNVLVENLRATLSEEIGKQEWMDPATRKNAIAKLSAFEAKIGYPDQWRSYSDVAIQRDAFVESLRSASLATRRYGLAKIGKPADRIDWGMTPPTVNAYYNPPKNESAFPAGILQPPLFDMEADDAVNYGAIGAVIGHEMGHGFDDQGSKYDFSGNLKNWWTPEDRKKFETRTQCVIEQFNEIDTGVGLRHNGRLVVGEALGDLGGLALAYRAYKRSLNGQPGPVLDGYTADQRFFLAFARLWGSQSRTEAMLMRLQTDPHPIARWRANATLMNMPEFHQAFSCKRGDPMVREPEKQCKLW